MENTLASAVLVRCNLSDDTSTDNCSCPSRNMSAEEFEEFKIADVVNLYVPPILIIVGNLCNILAFLVMRSHHFRSLSTSIYMSACAVNDAASLIISLTPHWLYVSFPWTIIRSSSSHYMCKFFNFYGYFNCDYTISLTTVMTADRAFVIMHPIKASTTDLVKRAKVIIIVLMVMVVAKEFHFLFYSDIVPSERADRLCDVILIEKSYAYFFKNIWPWIHISFLTLCFLVIIASNIIITIKVRRSDKMGNSISKHQRNNAKIDESYSRNNTTFQGSNFNQSTPSDNSTNTNRVQSMTNKNRESNRNQSMSSDHSKDSNRGQPTSNKNCIFRTSNSNQLASSNSLFKELSSSQSTSRMETSFRRSTSPSRSNWQQITAMLLTQSFVLIILTYPFSTHLAISSHISDLYTDPEKKAANQLVFSVVFYLLYSNKCVNFCLYCITGSRFRCALKELCSCRSKAPQFTVKSILRETALATSQTTLCSISLNQCSGSNLQNV